MIVRTRRFTRKARSAEVTEHIQFSGSFFDFIENDAAIDTTDRSNLLRLCMISKLKGVRAFTRKPIGSGFNVELRIWRPWRQ